MTKILTSIFCFIVINSFGQNVNRLDSLFEKKWHSIAGAGGGVSVVLADSNNKLTYNKSYGDFSLDKAVPIASASKWYAAAVLMSLVDEGKLSLNDKVSKYIPSFKGALAEITIEQCFSLTSGLPGSSGTLNEFMQYKTGSYAQMVDEIAKTALVAEPGTQLNYGGLSMQVAGRAAEIVSGKTWNQLFYERIVQPLGLTHTRYAGALAGYVPRVAGGVVSSGTDYLKLLDMLYHKGVYKGKRLLSENAVNTMLSDHNTNSSIGYSPFSKFKPVNTFAANAHYAIGNWVMPFSATAKVNVSPGAFGFTPWIDTQRGYYGLIAVRSSFVKAIPVFISTLQIINKPD